MPAAVPATVPISKTVRVPDVRTGTLPSQCATIRIITRPPIPSATKPTTAPARTEGSRNRRNLTIMSPMIAGNKRKPGLP